MDECTSCFPCADSAPCRTDSGSHYHLRSRLLILDQKRDALTNPHRRSDRVRTFLQATCLEDHQRGSRTRSGNGRSACSTLEIGTGTVPCTQITRAEESA